MRKTAAAAAMAASLTIGGGAGAVLFAPNLVGAQSDEPTTTEPAESTEDDARPERGQYLEDALAPLVTDGTIDQSQADAVIEALKDARPANHRFGPGHRMPLDGAVLDALQSNGASITAEELRTALQDGQTIAEIAEANGVSVDDVVAAIVAEAEERIEAAVENGRLTEDEAAEKKAGAAERAEDFVNGDFEFGEHRGGFGRGPGGPGPDAPAPDAPADDTTEDTTGS